MDMTPQRWAATSAYMQSVFGRATPAADSPLDRQLATLMDRAVAAGLPPIAVSAEVGKLLRLLASLINPPHGPRLIIEVGTLAGYSALWLAQALARPAASISTSTSTSASSPSPGRLITIEPVPLHADFAQREFDTAGFADRIQIRRGAGLDILPQLARELPPASADILFLDAIKTENPAYLAAARPLLAPSGLLIVDNALGTGSWWIDDPHGHNESRDAVDAFNRQLAADPEFDTAMIPAREGLLVARRLV